MDQRVIKEKLESLRRCYRRIEEKRPESAEELQDNFDLQDILSVNIERAVQLCVDIGTHIIANSEFQAPTSLGETFEILEEMEILDSKIANQMKKAVGFRNIAVHAYREINWDIVFHISHKGLHDLKAFAKRIDEHISS
ncbi:type VII toxin-antitoxin system HepT family RNase toxin [Rhodohalobacter sulfatireducens]|uniref:DUF86 domain-containing protein n=1 Tax=Rhodohalobacter sulfatireducens TaxID=2911366 RepID=A0ABS9K9G3_9BACT|nr:DUF86 domain-containing protein [Rhodohalobacter sulfatireducens]MCG2587507.1 DUF86 domain-containing protein [Rhodohalobacter sulfatireducens]